jgi:hypothetical protein
MRDIGLYATTLLIFFSFTKEGLKKLPWGNGIKKLPLGTETWWRLTILLQSIFPCFFLVTLEETLMTFYIKEYLKTLKSNQFWNFYCNKLKKKNVIRIMKKTLHYSNKEPLFTMHITKRFFWHLIEANFSKKFNNEQIKIV